MENPAETAEDMELDQAFEAAVAEHSTKEQAGEGGEAVEDHGSGDTEAESTQQSQDTDEAQGATDEGAEEQLLTDEEFAKVKDDPQAMRKAMNRAFTQKTQALAERRKQLDRYQRFIDAYEQDPLETLKQVAEQNGYRFVKPEEESTTEQPAKTTGDIEQAGDDAVDILREALGPELEGLADRLAPAIKQLVSNAANSVVEQRVKPLEERSAQSEAAEAKRQYDAALDRLDGRHKGWTKYKDKMVELDKKLTPQKGTTLDEYLDMLYHLASRDAQTGTKTKQIVKKINEAAQKSDDPGSGVPTSKVSSLPEDPTLEEAFELALQGKTIPWDD